MGTKIDSYIQQATASSKDTQNDIDRVIAKGASTTLAYETRGLDCDHSLDGGALQEALATQGFLDAGKADGVWFKISPETRKKFLEQAKNAGEDGPRMLNKLEQLFTRLNKLMGREDIDDEQKISFLQSMLSNPSGDYDSASGDKAYEALGSVVAELMTGHPEVLFAGGRDLDIDDVDLMVTQFEPQITKWMTDNQVSVKEDKSYRMMSELGGAAEEKRRRRAQMSPIDAAADIRKELTDLRQQYETKRAATPAPQDAGS